MQEIDIKAVIIIITRKTWGKYSTLIASNSPSFTGMALMNCPNVPKTNIKNKRNA
jgi:hypothetical protein